MLDLGDQLLRAAASFGGGVALSKNVCGTLTAAAMAAGAIHGNADPTGTAPRSAYAHTKAIIDRFQQRFGTTQCGDLTAPWQQDFANRARVYRCAELVHFVMEQLAEVLPTEELAPEWEEGWWSDYLTRRDKLR